MKYCPLCASELVSQKINGEMRQRCSSADCNYVFWDNPVPVVAAIVEHEGAVILVRSKGWPANWHGIVAGFMEKGETPAEGVLREVQEELGLRGEIVRFVGHYAFREKNQLILAYHVQAAGEIVLGDELESYKCILPEDLRPWPIGTGPALQDWLEARRNQEL